jgi:hypothetical protein
MIAARIAVLLMVAACARSEDVPEEALVEVEAAAPTEASAVEPAVPAPETPAPATWRAAQRGEGTTLRLVADDDSMLMTLACANVPREFVVNVPGFTRNPGDSRFSLALGSTPIILVADAATTSEGIGVNARAPAPADLAARFEAADSVAASYGGRTLGPYPTPDASIVGGLLMACGLSAPAAAVPPAE